MVSVSGPFVNLSVRKSLITDHVFCNCASPFSLSVASCHLSLSLPPLPHTERPRIIILSDSATDKFVAVSRHHVGWCLVRRVWIKRFPLPLILGSSGGRGSGASPASTLFSHARRQVLQSMPVVTFFYLEAGQVYTENIRKT